MMVNSKDRKRNEAELSPVVAEATKETKAHVVSTAAGRRPPPPTSPRPPANRRRLDLYSAAVTARGNAWASSFYSNRARGADLV